MDRGGSRVETGGAAHDYADAILRVAGLSKTYGMLPALDGAWFSIPSGRRLGGRGDCRSRLSAVDARAQRGVLQGTAQASCCGAWAVGPAADTVARRAVRRTRSTPEPGGGCDATPASYAGPDVLPVHSPD